MAVDTLVHMADAARGLICGYATVWGAWNDASIGGIPARFRYIKSAYYEPAPGLDFRRDHGAEIVGPVLSVTPTDAGLFCIGVLHDAFMMGKADRGQLYFSVNTVLRRGLYPNFNGGLISEISLVDDPAVLPLKAHIEHAERVNDVLDALSDPALLEAVASDPALFDELLSGLTAGTIRTAQSLVEHYHP